MENGKNAMTCFARAAITHFSASAEEALKTKPEK